MSHEESKLVATIKIPKPIDVEAEIEKIGRSLESRLLSFHKQWSGGIPYKSLISPLAVRAKRLGMDLSELTEVLETRGYILILSSPSSSRFVFTPKSESTMDQMNEWILDQATNREIEKSIK